nr:hypothetical protein [Oscillatoria sp. Prado101]
VHLAPETNGEVAYRAFQAEEKKVGLPLVDLAFEDARCALPVQRHRAATPPAADKPLLDRFDE